MTIHFARRTALVAWGLAWVSAAMGQSAAAPDSTTLEDARKELESHHAVLVDVREPEEHAMGVAPGAQLLPMSQMAARFKTLPNDPKVPLLLICNTQNRSRSIANALRERGFVNVRFVLGGMSEWTRRGWPLVKPRP